jgi:glycerol-3-phosphate O-acyltransferase
MSLSLLGAAPRAQTIEEMRDGMKSLRNWAKHRDIRFTSDFDDDNVKHMRGLIDAMVRAELINRYDEGPETIYAVSADQHLLAGYYRNTIVHHFVSKAITELALLHASKDQETALAEFWAEAHRLRDMFKFEFFYSPTDEFIDDIRAELNHFDEKWEFKLQNQSDFVEDFLPTMEPLVAHSTLRPYIESYRVVADVFSRLDENQTLDLKETISVSFKYANQAYLQQRISSKASIGKILFTNGFKLLESYGLVEAGGDDQLKKRKQTSKKFRLLAHRLDHLRSLAMPTEFD